MSDSVSTTNKSERAIAVTASGDGEAYWFYGNLAVVRSPEGSLPIVIEMHLPAGSAAPLHYHESLEDNWYVISGLIAVKDGDETVVVRPGDYVATRPGIPQSHFVLDGPAILLQLHARADFLDFVRQFGTPARDRSARPSEPIDFARGSAIATSTGQPVIGPPMSEQEARAIAEKVAG